jgi:hypothetical protein
MKVINIIWFGVGIDVAILDKYLSKKYEDLFFKIKYSI